jgi:hypothetical protein
VKENGKTAIVKDQFTSPIAAEDFVFEMTAHFEVMSDHTIHVTKCSHPSLRDCFPADYSRPLSIEDGEALAKWASGPGFAPQPQKPITNSLDPLSSAKTALWIKYKAKFNNSVPDFEKHLRTTDVLTPEETLGTLDLERMQKVCLDMGIEL